MQFTCHYRCRVSSFENDPGDPSCRVVKFCSNKTRKTRGAQSEGTGKPSSQKAHWHTETSGAKKRMLPKLLNYRFNLFKAVVTVMHIGLCQIT